MSGPFPFAVTAALNPTLLTATLVMLFAREPKRLLVGYVLGAYTISISLGLVVVFALEDSGAVSTTQRTVSPAADVVLGILLLLAAYALHGDRDARLQARRKAHAEAKERKERPRWRRSLDEGSARSAFVVGILLTLPGASFLAGMTRISKEHLSTGGTVLSVIAFCVIMLLLIEIPLLGFVVRPDSTRRGVRRFTDWVSTNTRMIATRVALVTGGLLLLRAAITLLS